MKVRELIGLLLQCDPEDEVEVWGAFSDEPVDPSVIVTDHGVVCVGLGTGREVTASAPSAAATP